MVFDESWEKMKFYQVWLDASPMIVAMGRRIEADESGNVTIVECNFRIVSGSND
jgi:hypothetical protein